MKRDASPGSMHDAGCLGLVHWDDLEGWYGEGGGRRVQDGEHMYTIKKEKKREKKKFKSINIKKKRKKIKYLLTFHSKKKKKRKYTEVTHTHTHTHMWKETRKIIFRDLDAE